MNRPEKTVQEYMGKNKLPDIINSMMNALIHTKEQQPLIFMVQLLLISRLSI